VVRAYAVYRNAATCIGHGPFMCVTPEERELMTDGGRDIAGHIWNEIDAGCMVYDATATNR